jgi:hypothetical protein
MQVAVFTVSKRSRRSPARQHQFYERGGSQREECSGQEAGLLNREFFSSTLDPSLFCSTPTGALPLLGAAMSETPPDTSESSPAPAAGHHGPKAKSGKSAKASGKSAKAAGKAVTSPSFPVFDLPDASPVAATAARDAASEGKRETPSTDGAKRNKRRRKKGKAGSQAPESHADQAKMPPPASAGSPATGEAPAAPQPRPAHAPKHKPDPEAVAKLARRIYLAEVSEEGVALIGDSEAKELSRRCFRLAEIFLEEQARRH